MYSKGKQGESDRRDADSKPVESDKISAERLSELPKSKTTHQHARRSRFTRRKAPRYAALDLGTNNCRLLIAAPRGKSMRIVDAYSKIVRLGENLSRTGKLSDAAMARTIEVLNICADKIKARHVTRMRLIATQACRGAENGDAFIKKIKEQTGLALEIIEPEEEARLAVLGCTDLFDEKAKAVLVFDIGGGSTEISWVRLPQNNDDQKGGETKKPEIVAWSSLPFGVVSLAEKWNGREIDRDTYDEIIEDVRQSIITIGDQANLKSVFESGDAHLLGTSGTVTSIAGVQLQLKRYRRKEVDGLWLSTQMISSVSEKLRAMSFEERANEPCIGPERADLVVCGCAILEAIMREWPVQRVRVADRGLREGMLQELAERDRRVRNRQRRRRRRYNG